MHLVTRTESHWPRRHVQTDLEAAGFNTELPGLEARDGDQYVRQGGIGSVLMFRSDGALKKDEARPDGRRCQALGKIVDGHDRHGKTSACFTEAHLYTHVGSCRKRETLLITIILILRKRVKKSEDLLRSNATGLKQERLGQDLWSIQGIGGELR